MIKRSTKDAGLKWSDAKSNTVKDIANAAKDYQGLLTLKDSQSGSKNLDVSLDLLAKK